MDLRSLNHVVTLSRELNFTRAAKALHLTQSALSRSIQATEAQCGLRLFDRDRGSVALTTAGREFVARADAILRDMNDFKATLERVARGEAGRIAIGMAPLPAQALLPALLPGLIDCQRSLDSRVYIRGASALLDLLLEETIDFFVCAEEQMPDSAPIRARPLGSVSLALVARAGHPLLGGSKAARQRSYPVVSAGPIRNPGGFPPYMAELLTDCTPLVVEDYGLLAHLTATSDALWPTPTMAIRGELESGALVEIPPPGDQKPVSFALVLHSLERRTLSPAAKRLVQAMVRQLAEPPSMGKFQGS